MQGLVYPAERSDFLQVVVVPLARDDRKPEIVLLGDGERFRQDNHEELHPVLPSPLVDVENPVLAVLLEVLRFEQRHIHIRERCPRLEKKKVSDTFQFF